MHSRSCPTSLLLAALTVSGCDSGNDSSAAPVETAGSSTGMPMDASSDDGTSTTDPVLTSSGSTSTTGHAEDDSGSSTGDTPPPPQDDRFPWSEWERPFTPPDCEATEGVVHITSSADWSSLNEPTARVFCVHPGDYRDAGVLQFSADGSQDAPRIITLFAPDVPADQHPAATEPSQQAILGGLRFDDADWWVIDRMRIDGEYARENVIDNGSSNNIFNRLVIEQYSGGGLVIENQCHTNTLQNSVVRRGPIYDGDRVAVILRTKAAGFNEALDTRFVNNEIYDATDGIQLQKHDADGSWSNFAGTIIENNDLYLTGEFHTDCNGTIDPAGHCSLFENGLDIKAGSDDPDKPVIVRNNRVWGWQRTDGASGSDSWGASIIVHQISQYVLLERNYVFDTSRGIAMYGTRNSMVDNVVADVHADSPGGGIALVVYESDHQEVYRNTVARASTWNSTASGTGDFRCNTLLDAGGPSGGADLTADYNFYFGSAPLSQPGTHDLELGSSADAQMEDLCFHRKLWTAPEEYCIAGVVASELSPQRDACDPNLGGRPGFGIHDEPW